MCYNYITKNKVGKIMEISKKALVVTFIINLLLVAVSVACVIVLNFSSVSLWIFAAIAVLVFVSSVLIWHYGKDYRPVEE